jgi:transcriptional regulator of acetoin/glycerol metabolism
MTPLMHKRDEHLHRVLDVVGGSRHGQVDELVAHSWARCLHEHRLQPDRPPQPPVFGSDELDARRHRVADLLDCARHEMATLFHQLADPHSAVVLTDTDGVILHMVSSPEFEREVAPMGFTPGAVWSEAVAGTNGMGTCLAAARPVSVRQEDHFFAEYTSLTCSAVPVHDPSGRVAGALDVTSRSGLAQQHVLVLLGMTARMIENRLLDRHFRHAHPLHFHSRPEFVYTLHEGRLVVADDGAILAANRSALLQLGLRSTDEIRGRPLHAIFQTSLDDMLARSSAAGFHPVVTYRSSAAHRFFAVVRPPVAEVPTPPLGVGGGIAPGITPGITPGMATGIAAGITPKLPAAAPRRAAVEVDKRAAEQGPEPFADPLLKRHLATARRVVARGTPLLLCGETGAGKEVFARAVHEASPKAGGAFVAVNCASLPETLIESELFGYRPGAFTGAQRSGRRGKILQADGGTLFLDEIGDMPLHLQARLLRVLDERQVTPLGSEDAVPVDLQLVSASHRQLAELVRDGRFREDLYYRLAGIELALPPLRERADRRELMARILQEEAGAPMVLSAAAEQALMAYRWPGNVRQLRHVLRTAVALADGARIEAEHLPALKSPLDAPAAAAPAAAPTEAAAAEDDTAGLNEIQANERQVLLRLLEQHRWKVSNVAKALDVSRNTLYRKLHKLRIPVGPRP